MRRIPLGVFYGITGIVTYIATQNLLTDIEISTLALGVMHNIPNVLLSEGEK